MSTVTDPRRDDEIPLIDETGVAPRRRGFVLDEARLDRSVLALAWPVLVQQMALSLVQLVDTFLVGHLGTDALAGVGLATFIQWTPQAGVFALTAGTTAVLARDIGAGKREQASVTLRHGLFLSLIWGIVSFAFVFLAAHWSLNVMGAKGATLALGTEWLQWASPGVLAGAVLFVATGSLQGAGDTRTPMLVMIAVNVVNAIVAYTLIHGSFMLPTLGVAGSGIGFAASQALGMVLILLALSRRGGALHVHWPSFLHFERPVARRILNVGVPAGLEQVQFQFAMLAYTRIISSLGDTALAAHSVAIRVQGLAFMPGMAFSQAATAMTGQALGGKNPRLAERAAYSAVKYALYILCAVAVLLALFGGVITRIFIDDPSVTETGRKLLLIFAIAQPGIAIAFTLAGALRGAGDTKAVMYIFAISPWIMRVGFAYLFAIVLGWGVEGAWIGAVLDMWTRAGLTALRFHTGRWKAIRV